MSRATDCLALALVALAAGGAQAAQAAAPDLSSYVRVGRYDLPQQAQEASGVAYDAARDSLFVVGDGAASIVQVSKTGQLIDSMALSGFVDTEGIATAAGAKLVVAEERERRVNRFTYVAGGTLTRDGAESVKLGTTIGNTGIEGIADDPAGGGLVAVKESTPQGIFATGVDFAAGTATNGSPTTESSTNLFDPALLGLGDLSDVYALAGGELLVISQESGRILAVARTGQITSSLAIASDPGNPLSVADQGHEGITMDGAGRIYVVNEAGGGSTAVPQLWVYAPTAGPNLPPTAVTLTNPVGTVVAPGKVAGVSVTDDGIGTNNLTVSDANFTVDASGLYVKAGTPAGTYTLTVAADDPTVGAAPDATSAPLTVTVTAPATTTLSVTEASPWSSGNSPYEADWFEVTNRGAAPVELAGWRVDDSSNAVASAVALTGVASIAPGESVLFVEGTAAVAAELRAAWGIPASVRIGSYSGSGIGLSTDGDAVNLFDAGGSRVTGVTFGASTTGFTFDNAAGISGAISTLSVAGRNGAFTVGGETGSPGAVAPSLIVSELSPWSSGNSPYRADWIELTNTGAHPVDITGFKIDDSSNAFASAVALTGVSTLAAGESAIFLEGAATVAAAFKAAWFGADVPAGLQVGTYSGSGIGLSTDGDALNVFDPAGNRVTGVTFGASTSGFTFDNAAGVSGAISALSVAGVNGAFTVGGETGSPGAIAAPYEEVVQGGEVTGVVPPQLALTLGASAVFAPFTAGVAKDYLAQTTATVTSTAGDAALTVADTATTAPGHLVSGSFALPQALQVSANGGAFAAVSGAPATLLAYTGPVSSDEVAIGLKQPIGAKDALRTGTYAKTLTFTLSTSTP